jgi:hypothetical protein
MYIDDVSSIEVQRNDYFSYDDIKSIVESQIRNEVSYKLKRDLDFERIFNNAAYEIVFKEMENHVDYNIKEMINNKVFEIVSSASHHGLFKRKDAWEREDSKSYTYLQEAVENNKNIIEDKVKEELGKLDTQYLADLVQDTVYKILDERLR